MEVRANGLLVVKGHIVEPKNGPWTAHLEVDDEAGKIVGPVTITMGSTSFTGTASGAVEAGRYIARVVGGNGGLSTQLQAKYYYQSALSVVVADILRESGEVLDFTETDEAVTTFIVARWMRLLGEARTALKQVASEVGGFWRVTRAGAVALKRADAWLPVSFDYTEINRDPGHGIVTIAPEDEPLARPGVSVGGDRCSEVRTEWDGSELRQILTLESDTRPRGMVVSWLDAARRMMQPAIDYSRWYPARVISQHADGSLELYPDDERVRGNGLTRVPLLHGIPGVSVKVAAGGRVRLFFEAGDPKLPAAALWPDGSSVVEVSIGGSGPIALAALVEAEFVKIATAIQGLSGSYTFVAPIPPALPGSIIGTTKLKGG
jgi:hypothetical protein